MKKIDIKIPDGKSGDWSVETFTVSEGDANLHNMRCAINHRTHRRIEPGTYKKLVRNGTIVMSNTPAEILDHVWFARWAKGAVLVNGLGLGVVLEMLLERPEVYHVTVIEKSKDVIRLVAPFYESNPKVTIVNADAFTYKPEKGRVYGAVWHDIWDYITSDNLPEMHKLHRKYGRRTKSQGSWCRELCEQQ